MDLSPKCYLFCEFNSVRIGHSIQNEVSLERSIFAADVVADQFINLNWKLTGSREEYIHRAIWDGNDPNRPKRLFIPVWREIHWSKILTLTSWQLTNRTVSDISRLSRHSICQSFFPAWIYTMIQIHSGETNRPQDFAARDLKHWSSLRSLLRT